MLPEDIRADNLRHLDMSEIFQPKEIERRKEFLARFWSGEPVDRHARYTAKYELSLEPAGNDWTKRLVNQLRTFCEQAKWDDDYIPMLDCGLGVAITANAFGCKTIQHEPGGTVWAEPLFTTQDPAPLLDLVKPSARAGQLGEVLEYMEWAQEMTGYAFPVRTADLQGPLDIAGQVWKDECLFKAMFDAPDAVHHLVNLCMDLLIDFIREEREVCRDFCAIHCPHIWMPYELGAALSEDYSPVVSPSQYAEFSLPYVNRISEAFNGMFIHCCGTFAHQFDNYRKMHNLRGVQLIIPFCPWDEVLDAFSGHCAIVPSLHEVDLGDCQDAHDWFMRRAREDTRLFLC